MWYLCNKSGKMNASALLKHSNTQKMYNKWKEKIITINFNKYFIIKCKVWAVFLNNYFKPRVVFMLDFLFNIVHQG